MSNHQTGKISQAANYLASWIETNARFDLLDVCDRVGVSQELQYLIKEYTSLLRDDLNNAELEEFYLSQLKEKEKTQIITPFLKDLVKRFWS